MDKPKVIAEISCNHKGILENALDLIAEAKRAGCDYVKIQLYQPEYFSSGTLKDKYELTKTPFEWIPKLVEHAKAWNIKLFTTVYSVEDVKKCEEYNVFPIYKISSFECEDYKLIDAVLATKKKLFISLDLCEQPEEIFRFFFDNQKNIKLSNRKPDVIFKCTSQYPAEHKNMHLKTIDYLKKNALHMIC